MIDEFDLNSKSDSENEKIDNWDYGFDDDNLTEKEINRICKEQLENKYFDNRKNYKIESNEIIEVRYGNDLYKVWKVEFIRPLVINFLKEKYPNSLIVRELNKIDLTLLSNYLIDEIPIEIQKTSMAYDKFNNTDFENKIRKGLEDNIETYKICWFFFDFEYLRYLQSENVGKSTSIDLTWIVKLMKENTLKVFAIKYDGEVKELTIKDFDFLKNISNTYEIEYENDERILNKNKLKIFHNVINGYNFTQEEITQFESEFDNRIYKEIKHQSQFFIKYGNKRCKLYGNILKSVGDSLIINEILCMDSNNDNASKFRSTYLGIFEVVGTYGNGNLIRFTDKFDICKYFPGYLRNKEQWESYRNTNLTHETFTMITNGSLKQNKTMMDFMKVI